MPVPKKLISEWLEKAHDDELNARSILTHRDGTPGAVCFLSQQMAEKFLKSLLVFHQKELPKIHDLIRLENLLIENEPEVKNLHEDLVVLNGYYIETRYPGDYPEFSWNDAEEALAAAEKIKSFVFEKENPK